MNENLVYSLKALFSQLRYMVEQLTDEQYVAGLHVLSGASLGAHLRHVIEFFQELEKGYANGCVDYDARVRQKELERSREIAVSELESIALGLKAENKSMQLRFNPGMGSECFEVATHYERELIYNLEHTVHHMALLKIGVRAVADITLPDEFGVAISTLKYREQLCAQ